MVASLQSRIASFQQQQGHPNSSPSNSLHTQYRIEEETDLICLFASPKESNVTNLRKNLYDNGKVKFTKHKFYNSMYYVCYNIALDISKYDLHDLTPVNFLSILQHPLKRNKITLNTNFSQTDNNNNLVSLFNCIFKMSNLIKTDQHNIQDVFNNAELQEEMTINFDKFFALDKEDIPNTKKENNLYTLLKIAQYMHIAFENKEKFNPILALKSFRLFNKFEAEPDYKTYIADQYKQSLNNNISPSNSSTNFPPNNIDENTRYMLETFDKDFVSHISVKGNERENLIELLYNYLGIFINKNAESLKMQPFRRLKIKEIPKNINARKFLILSIIDFLEKTGNLDNFLKDGILGIDDHFGPIVSPNVSPFFEAIAQLNIDVEKYNSNAKTLDKPYISLHNILEHFFEITSIINSEQTIYSTDDIKVWADAFKLQGINMNEYLYKSLFYKKTSNMEIDNFLGRTFEILTQTEPYANDEDYYFNQNRKEYLSKINQAVSSENKYNHIKNFDININNVLAVVTNKYKNINSQNITNYYMNLMAHHLALEDKKKYSPKGSKVIDENIRINDLLEIFSQNTSAVPKLFDKITITKDEISTLDDDNIIVITNNHQINILNTMPMDEDSNDYIIFNDEEEFNEFMEKEVFNQEKNDFYRVNSYSQEKLESYFLSNLSNDSITSDNSLNNLSTPNNKSNSSFSSHINSPNYSTITSDTNALKI